MPLVFQYIPDNFSPVMEVSACFMAFNHKFLFLKRQPGKSAGNTWGIPGGKIDRGETALDAVIREVKEETSAELLKSSLQSLGKVYIRDPEHDFVYHMFEYTLENYPDIAIEADAHSEFRWLTLNEALSLPLIPGEDECIHLCYGSKISNN